MEDAKAFWVAHRDEDRAHLHIVASKIHPETGRAYDLKSDHFKLSKWAEQYERENGGIACLRRQEANPPYSPAWQRFAGGRRISC